MDLFIIAFLAFVGSFLGFAMWAFRERVLGFAPRGSWTCLVCQIPNEGELEACWSCGRPAGESPTVLPHRDHETRWPCEACGLMNAAARPTCANCGRTLPERGE